MYKRVCGLSRFIIFSQCVCCLQGYTYAYMEYWCLHPNRNRGCRLQDIWAVTAPTCSQHVQMWSTWTAGGTVTLTRTRLNHCRGITPVAHVACEHHAHAWHTCMQCCRGGGVWLAGQSKGPAESVSPTLDTQMHLSISLSVCYWNKEWLITAQQTHLLSDFCLICEDRCVAA